MSTVAETRRVLTLRPARQEEFAPYGRIAETAGDPTVVNNGTALRHEVGSMGTDNRPGSRLVCSIFETRPQRLPLTLSMLERHPCSAQAIIPMQRRPFALAVCLSDEDGLPDLETLRAFLFHAGQGAIYHPKVWHHPIIGLDRAALFFVQSWQDGLELDYQEVPIAPHWLEAPVA
jgi:ureidoglycolate lyase